MKCAQGNDIDFKYSPFVSFKLTKNPISFLTYFAWKHQLYETGVNMLLLNTEYVQYFGIHSLYKIILNNIHLFVFFNDNDSKSNTKKNGTLIRKYLGWYYI